MSGYTPLFSSLTTGTLCGKWPDLGLWPIVLSLADRHGEVDVTVAYLTRITGLPAEEVCACMGRFCEGDPDSRSSEEGGARLVLVEPENRNWGWRIVNHGKYREKARLMAKDAARTESGADAERKRAQRNSPDVPRSPPASPSQTRLNKTKQDTLKKPLSRLVPASFHDDVIAAYHELLPNLPGVKAWTKKRRQLLDSRIEERCADGKPADQINYWREFFEKVAASDFLCGATGDFAADLEWLIRPENFLRTIEGRYDKRSTGNGNGHRPHAAG